MWDEHGKGLGWVGEVARLVCLVVCIIYSIRLMLRYGLDDNDGVSDVWDA